MIRDDPGTVDFAAQVASVAGWLGMLDDLPDAVVFLKDERGRYVFANRTLAQRLGVPSPDALLGKTAADVFPAPLGDRYVAQDAGVLAGQDLSGQLEVHLYPTRQPGWCLTSKRAVRNASGRSVGIAGVSRDVHINAAAAPRLAVALHAIHERHAEPLRMRDMADLAGMSVKSFERHVRAVFGLTPAQLLTRARIEAALRYLDGTDLPVARIAVECGYFDHSAFTRAFRTAVGVTPTTYRRLRREGRHARR